MLDDQDQWDHMEVQTGYWKIQSTHLVQAYLQFHASSNNEGMVVVLVQCKGEVTAAFTIKVIDTFFKLATHFFLLSLIL
jgi:hypothetical protein